MASVLRRDAAQVWLSTRLGSIGQTFRPEEVVRLTVDHQGARQVHRGAMPQSRSERIAARHLHLQLLPAVSSRAVAIVEGPHDRIALSACGTKLNSEDGEPLLAARRIALLDAAAAEGSGGIAAIPRLARLARGLGFFVVAVIDWDRDEEAAQQLLDANLAAADVVIRWPEGYAIERSLLEGLDEEVARAALAEVAVAAGVKPEFDLDAVTEADLVRQGSRFIKSAGGLHGLFVDALPAGTTPPLVRRCLAELRASIGKGGLVQL